MAGKEFDQEAFRPDRDIPRPARPAALVGKASADPGAWNDTSGVIRNAGFTIIELLIVVGIIGILAAIVIPNYLNAINRARQKTTMATMRSVAIAWEARATETKSYNAAATIYTLPSQPIDSAGVTSLLTPTYIRVLPIVDGWGHSLDFFMDVLPGSGQTASTYAIRSRGRDGLLDGGGTTYTFGPISRFDCDIVYGSGTFVTEPQGVSQ